MAGAFFVQPCPICGRHLEVRVRFLGKQVACRHCGGQFEACDPETSKVNQAARISDLQKADQLLSEMSSPRHYPR